VNRYYLYLNLTRSVLDIFNCQPTTPPDGHTYLRKWCTAAVSGMVWAGWRVAVSRLSSHVVVVVVVAVVAAAVVVVSEVVFEDCHMKGGVRETLLPFAIIALCG
jgi:hypothetical protein